MWRSVPCTFQVLLQDDGQQFWQALQRREKIGADYEAMYPSLLQRVYQLGVFWLQANAREKKKLDDGQLYRAFKDNLNVTSGERLTEKFVRVGLQVFQKVVSVKRLKDLLICGDETFGKKNPLDSLYKLQILLQTAHNEPDKIHWLLLMMFDLLLNKDVAPGTLTMEALSGKKGGKGFLRRLKESLDLF